MTSQQRMLGKNGETIGFVEEGTGSDGERRVTDSCHRTLGYVSDHGTFDSNRQRVSDDQIIGLLLNKKT